MKKDGKIFDGTGNVNRDHCLVRRCSNIDLKPRFYSGISTNIFHLILLNTYLPTLPSIIVTNLSRPNFRSHEEAHIM